MTNQCNCTNDEYAPVCSNISPPSMSRIATSSTPTTSVSVPTTFSSMNLQSPTIMTAVLNSTTDDDTLASTTNAQAANGTSQSVVTAAGLPSYVIGIIVIVVLIPLLLLAAAAFFFVRGGRRSSRQNENLHANHESANSNVLRRLTMSLFLF